MSLKYMNIAFSFVFVFVSQAFRISGMQSSHKIFDAANFHRQYRSKVKEVYAAVDKSQSSVAWRMSYDQKCLSANISKLTKFRVFEMEEKLDISLRFQKSIETTVNAADIEDEVILMKIKHGRYEIPCNIPMLLELAKPSSFGFKENTLFDETVRLGKELSTEEVVITLLNEYLIERKLSQTLFAGKYLEFKFYKLALYEPGGMS
jgi:hypothetical protein